MMKKLLIFLSMLMLISVMGLVAQEDPEVPVFDWSIFAAILTAGGLGVLGITEMIKRILHKIGLTGKIVGYAVSLIVGAACTWLILAQLEAFSFLNLIIYTAVVFIEANGIYKFPKPKNP